MMNVYQIAPAGDKWFYYFRNMSPVSIHIKFQLTAPGVTGLGIAVLNHVVAGFRMEQGPFPNLLNMEAPNAQDNQLAHRAVILMHVPKNQERVKTLYIYTLYMCHRILYNIFRTIPYVD